MTDQKIFQASAEAKGKATQLRLFAFIAWVAAIAGEIFAIVKLIHNQTLTWLIVAIVVILILAVVGSLLWKKANRLDPASEKEPVKFFIQNQLGAIISVLAFLPLVIFIFMNKDIDKKTKGIAGVVAIIALLIAGVTGADFNPPSIEKYSKEINEQDSVLSKINPSSSIVYWTKAGNKYHIYKDCYHIKGKDLSEGTIKQSFEQKGISELCLTCKSRALKENNITDSSLIKQEEVADTTK